MERWKRVGLIGALSLGVSVTAVAGVAWFAQAQAPKGRPATPTQAAPQAPA
jgi:hypothetical protein